MKNSALTSAVCSRNNEIVKLLLDSGAKIENKYELGLSAFLSAVCNIEIVRTLIKYRGDQHIPSNTCEAALSFAIEMNYTEIVKLLQEITSKSSGK